MQKLSVEFYYLQTAVYCYKFDTNPNPTRYYSVVKRFSFCII